MMPPSFERNDELRRIIRAICWDRLDAAEWFIAVIDLSHIADAIEDGDEFDKARAVQTIGAVAVGWGLNRFYIEHARELSLVALNCWHAWKSSDLFPELRCKAFDVATELGCTIAFLVGGHERLAMASPTLREWAFRRMKEDDAKDKNEPL